MSLITAKLTTATPLRQLFASTRSEFSTTTPVALIQKWRRDKGLSKNPNSCGPLTDKKDYSYLDGRISAYGIGQMKRILKQQEIAQKIIDLTAEVDFAVERHKRLQQEQQQLKNDIITSKLKEKGDKLLEKE